MAGDPLNSKGPGKFPAQGRQVDYGESAEMTGGWEMGVPTAGDSDGGSRVVNFLGFFVTA